MKKIKKSGFLFLISIWMLSCNTSEVKIVNDSQKKYSILRYNTHLLDSINSGLDAFIILNTINSKDTSLYKEKKILIDSILLAEKRKKQRKLFFRNLFTYVGDSIQYIDTLIFSEYFIVLPNSGHSAGKCFYVLYAEGIPRVYSVDMFRNNESVIYIKRPEYKWEKSTIKEYQELDTSLQIKNSFNLGANMTVKSYSILSKLVVKENRFIPVFFKMSFFTPMENNFDMYGPKGF